MMSPSVARRVVDLFQQFRPPENTQHGLTQQEMRLLKLLGDGHHYKTAAAELRVSIAYREFSSESDLRKVASTLKVGGGCQGDPEGLIR